MSLIRPWLLISHDGTPRDNKSLHGIESGVFAGEPEKHIPVSARRHYWRWSKTADMHLGWEQRETEGTETDLALRFSRWAAWIFHPGSLNSEYKSLKWKDRYGVMIQASGSLISCADTFKIFQALNTSEWHSDYLTPHTHTSTTFCLQMHLHS